MALSRTVAMLDEHSDQFLIFILIIFFFYIFVHLFLRINRTRPVPLNWPVVGMLPGLLLNAHRYAEFLTDLLEATDCTFVFKGPWFSGMNYVFTCDPANANYIFNTQSGNFPNGKLRREMTIDVLGDSLLISDGDLWRHQRRMSHAHTSNLQFRSSVARLARQKVENAMLPLLSRMAEEPGRVVKLHEVFKRFTFDVTCTAVLGIDPESLSPDFPIVPFAAAVHDAEEGMFGRGKTPQFWWKLKRRLQIGSEKKITAACRVSDQFVAQRIAERREARQRWRPELDESCYDLLSATLDREVADLSHLDEDDAEYVRSDKFVHDAMLTFLVAGNESMSDGLSWFFHLLMLHPQAENEILKELRGVSSIFDIEEIDRLVYLHAAVCESLRLYPPVPSNYKSPMKEDVLPSGHKVKPGYMIVFATCAMGRMKAIWGDDCVEFKPERWIDADGKLRREPSHKFVVFSCGPRLCPGRNIAFVVIKTAIAAVLYNFRMRPAVGHIGKPRVRVTLQMKGGLKVELSKRLECA